MSSDKITFYVDALDEQDACSQGHKKFRDLNINYFYRVTNTVANKYWVDPDKYNEWTGVWAVKITYEVDRRDD